MGREIGEWCLIRYAKDGFKCGVLSVSEPSGIKGAEHLGCLGFPEGNISPDFLTFQSKEEAESCIDTQDWENCTDKAELVSEQRWGVKVYSHWGGTKEIVYQGCDIEKLRAHYHEQIGIKLSQGLNYVDVSIVTIDNPPPKDGE